MNTYRIETPEGDIVEAGKGGKVPTFATWAFFPKGHPNGEGWLRVGWSFIADEATAQKRCLPDFRKYGFAVRVTRVLADEQPAAEVIETVVTVDLVTPTKGLVTVAGTEAGGTVLNDAKRESRPGAGWSAEDGEGAVLATGIQGVKAAAVALARQVGVSGPIRVVVHHEYRQTGERD